MQQQSMQAQPMQQQPVIQPGVIQTPDAVREKRIHRQTATKVAVEAVRYLAPEDQNLASIIRISEQLVQYYESGVQWTVPPVGDFQPQTPDQPFTQQPQGYENPGEFGGGYQHDDDDIPF